MRDQDMADVIVIGPGIWDRESDVLYEELLRREEEEEASGIVPSECSSRPRAKGGRLTEQNLKLWATMVSVFWCGAEEILMYVASDTQGAVVEAADGGFVCQGSEVIARGRSSRACTRHARIAAT